MYLKRLMNWLASKVKGEEYLLDKELNSADVVLVASRRILMALRGAIRLKRLHSIVFVGRNVTLMNTRKLKIGNGVTLQDGSVLDGLSKKGEVIGDNVNIGPSVIIKASGILTNLGVGLSMGKNSGIGAFSFVGCGGGVTIGENVIMGQYVSFHSENHNHSRTDLPIRLQGTNRKGITLGDDCWVGAKVTFLDGCIVGKGCVVAAGSVVRGEFPEYSVIAGVPARVIRSRKAS